ncbi:MAG: hypothetical protein SGARI_003659, partial [Bacillariaceae sp.]
MALPNKNKKLTTLSDLSRLCIVANLERFPPEALGILDEFEWDGIIRLRHKKSKPLKGRGGLDGTGRLNPSVGEKVIALIEEINPHLANSKVADGLVWKDIVEYRFRQGGLSRPKGLLAPWPVLIERLQESGKALNACLLQQQGNQQAALQAVKYIEESPMDLTLLKDSGIGKTVKKFLAKAKGRLDFLDEPYVFSTGKDIRKTPRSTLHATLATWMEMAARSGVKIKSDGASSPKRSAVKGNDNDKAEDRVDLSTAKKCHSWRELYQTLKIHDETRKTKQGEKMRERRQRLDSVRPRVVKVRHASSKQEGMLNRGVAGRGFAASAASPPGNSKMAQLKKEARVTSSRRQPPTAVAASKQRSGFGAAVAFANVGKTVAGKRKGAPSTKTVALQGGKRIKVPEIKKTASINTQKRLN